MVDIVVVAVITAVVVFLTWFGVHHKADLFPTLAGFMELSLLAGFYIDRSVQIGGSAGSAGDLYMVSGFVVIMAGIPFLITIIMNLQKGSVKTL